MNGTRHQTPFGPRLAAAAAAGAFGALALAGPAVARPDPGPALPIDGAPQGVDVGLAKHGNMPPLTETESGTLTDDDGVAYVQIGLGALSGAAFTAAAAVVVIGFRRHGTPHPA